MCCIWVVKHLGGFVVVVISRRRVVTGWIVGVRQNEPEMGVVIGVVAVVVVLPGVLPVVVSVVYVVVVVHIYFSNP